MPAGDHEQSVSRAAAGSRAGWGSPVALTAAGSPAGASSSVAAGEGPSATCCGLLPMPPRHQPMKRASRASDSSSASVFGT
jgi:hypothetical protein